MVVSYAAAIALSMLLFVLALNVVVAWYARGTVRAALDEAVRAAAVADVGGPQACRAHIDRVVGQLLAGPWQRASSWDCTDDGAQVTATATVTVDGWLGVPDWTWQLDAAATREPRL